MTDQTRTVTFTPLDGDPGLPLAARPDPDLGGYETAEFAASGHAVAYSAPSTPSDGRWDAEPGLDRAAFTTRVVVRRPELAADFSGTVVVEWFNVSAGFDAAPGWTFLAEEIVRRGHAWVGVSAQHVGVHGGAASIDPSAARSAGLRGDPRYADLHHPGDTYSYDVFTAVAGALGGPGRPLADVEIRTLLAVGESQSAMCLTTYLNAVHRRARVFDGFLVHSRAGAAPPLQADTGAGFLLADVMGGPAVRLREDLDVPVIVVQTEGDLVGRLHFTPARQPDHAHLRTWEVAGSAHADRFVIGELESLLGCAEPVNRGQQVYVVRAALAHLDAWVRTGQAPPHAEPVEMSAGAVVRDEWGIARGGVRTPVVAAPADVVSGTYPDGASITCQLFGTTRPLPDGVFEQLYADAGAYRAAYAAATDAAVAHGFVLAADRDAVLGEAR